MKMKGKKWIAAAAALALALAMTCAAVAETIRPLPVQTDINRLTDRFVTTNIEYRENSMAALTLYENERFDAETIRAVKPGDVIVTDGEEVTVDSVSWDGPDLYFNRGTGNEMLFCENVGEGTFEHVYHDMDDRIPQVLIGCMDVEILPYMIMLDWVDAKTGEPLDQVAVRDGEELLALLKSNDGPGFSAENVRVLYGSLNMPNLFWRYYSPAQ